MLESNALPIAPTSRGIVVVVGGADICGWVVVEGFVSVELICLYASLCMYHKSASCVRVRVMPSVFKIDHQCPSYVHKLPV